MNRLTVLLLMTALLLSGCHTVHRLPRQIVIVPDVSKSIDPQAEQQMFEAIQTVASRLQRGDSLTIIPITGNAETELQGRTLHYKIPPVEDRQAYDTDIRKINTQIKNDLARLQVDAIAHAGRNTDIMGTIRLALREFSDSASDRRLVILSDFIQDDAWMNFRKNAHLADLQSAAGIAEDAVQQIGRYPGMTTFLGRLRSSEFSSLPRDRQLAINTFWEQVLSPARVCADGPAALSAL